MILHGIGKELGLAFQIMDDVLEASSDSTTLGKSNQSDLTNQKLTYVSAFGEEASMEKAYALSNNCITKLNNSFMSKEIKDLLSLAKFMVERKN